MRDRLTLAFVAIVCFWLGYQAACFDIEMTGAPKNNPFSPRIKTISTHNTD